MADLGATSFTRDMFDPITNQVDTLATKYKASVDSINAANGAISTAKLLELQFDSQFMTMITDIGSGLVSALKGAVQSIMQKM